MNMKKVFIIFVAAMVFAACKTSDKKSEAPLTKEEIEKAKTDSSNFTSSRPPEYGMFFSNSAFIQFHEAPIPFAGSF